MKSGGYISCADKKDYYCGTYHGSAGDYSPLDPPYLPGLALSCGPQVSGKSKGSYG